VNAYTLTFAVLLLTGAALGDRFGRALMFSVGIGIFTLSSRAAALAPSATRSTSPVRRRASGGAIVTPLTLTILVAAVPPSARARARRVGGIGGLAVAIGRSSAAPSSRASRGSGSSG
jgi:MFS family permease